MARMIICCTSVLAIGILGGAVPAQAQDGGATIACPPTIELTYTAIKRLPFEGKEYDLNGMQPSFGPTIVRLIDPDVTPLADNKNEMMSGMADNGEEAKAGEPLVYTLWGEGQPAPESPSAITCRYEGGYALQKALPATTRACTLRYQRGKSPVTEHTTRELYTSAVFSCR
ncbi:hypothetical protein SR870_13985 [Rhodopseudomonas palustris]|uniref:hypothetical protein n=1 Tax=Rhodopseudomonas palustris TaxID=1076 RepID=UPI002ACDC356|nr:hypothetical protein [Rhodopseudomonas palustris]WQG97822.1 hypothetical protein SR870_13985 [Rhodopseudomonas palustris]